MADWSFFIYHLPRRIDPVHIDESAGWQRPASRGSDEDSDAWTRRKRARDKWRGAGVWLGLLPLVDTTGAKPIRRSYGAGQEAVADALVHRGSRSQQSCCQLAFS